MIDFKPGVLRRRMGQAPMIAPAVPPPSPDVLYTGYTGIPGVVETLLVLAATSAGAVLGLTTALKKGESKTNKTIGWVGGIGSALAGLLYLGTKAGIPQAVGLPTIRISPS